jgi:hypothetical protein
MKKQDLTQYSDDELSLVVMNDEYFYKIRKSILRDPSQLNEWFIFTDDQLEVLKTDLQEESADNE